MPSHDFQKHELEDPIFTTELNPGDLLYLPRGYIHEAMSVKETHSLHLTISTQYKNTWGDLMNELTASALQKSSEDNLDWRKSLPNDW